MSNIGWLFDWVFNTIKILSQTIDKTSIIAYNISARITCMSVRADNNCP